MDLTRRVAVRLALEGVLHIEQSKQALNPSLWNAAGRKGIVRLRLVRSANRVAGETTGDAGPVDDKCK